VEEYAPQALNTSPMTHLSRRTLIRRTAATAAVAAATGTVAPGLLAHPASAAPRIAGGPSRGPAAGVVEGSGLRAHIRPRTPAQLALAARLDDTHQTFDDGTIEVLLWDGDLDRLEAVGMDVDLVPPVQAAAVRPAGLPRQPGETEDGDYRPSATAYADEVQALVAAHADTGRVRLLTMPTRSLLGQTIYGLEIATDVEADDGRPVVMHDGMHHCREWPSGEMPMMWAHELLERYGNPDAPEITEIVDGCRTIILPLVNPDGFDRTREALTGTTRSNQTDGLVLAITGQGDMWRKNLRGATTAVDPVADVTGPAIGGSPVGASQPDAYGIDLNRNYPFLWGDESGASSVPVDQTYRGLEPFSEPESHNVRDLVRTHLPITHITHHTFGRQMLMPWGRNPDVIQSPDIDLLRSVAEDMRDGYTDAAGRTFEGNGYEAIQAFGLYPTSGTSRDYGHAIARSLIYTFEHSTEFHGPYEAVIPELYVQNRGAFVRHAQAAMDPHVHCRIHGTGPAGGTVTLSKDVETPTNLQLVGVPLLTVGGLPAVADPTAGTVRPDRVAERIEKVVRIGPDGTFDVRVPPSTRPFLVNEDLLDLGVGATEAFTVTIADVAGAVVRTTEVEIDRGQTVELPGAEG
jgi:hypothetical protein